MRVAIDARPAAFPERTGIGQYVWYLLRELPAADPASTYIAWYLNARGALGRHRAFDDIRAPNLVDRGVPIPSRLFALTARLVDAPRVERFARFDVLFAPNFVPPPNRAPRLVVTVHDLAYRLFPETAPRSVRRWLAGAERALAVVSRVIAVSERTKADLLESYPALEYERVVVVPHGVDHQVYRPIEPGEDAARVVGERVRERFGISGPYLLYLGGFEPRKNLPTLLDAFAALPDQLQPALVLAGSGVRWNPEGTDQLRRALDAMPADARRRVVLTGYVSGADKVGLLQGALALVNPTLYEGFGLQVLEAMACGIPVLASDVSALPEVAEGAALLVDPHDAGAIASGLERLITDDPTRERLRLAGVERARRFSWKETAGRTARVLHEAAEGA